MFKRLFADFSNMTFESLLLFCGSIAVVLAGDEARPLLDELLPFAWVPKIIAIAKLVSLLVLWRAYSPNHKPLGAPDGIEKTRRPIE